MRQLKSHLSEHAHPCYSSGLTKTGIEIDRIPNISEMSKKLEEFGWRALPVSGFIPPAAFMELQSLSYLPIASDMRTIEHLLYTPAPDIVHEAAGHAPILVDPAFAAYLKSYASVARKALLAKEDLDQYEAIRILSDLKEDPNSTANEIARAEKNLEAVTSSIKEISEAALLGRMNWWTAEYGLIGSLNNPRIFGAGLLSSVGESRSCLDATVRKIPLTIDCINYSYDITEKQPQLFVVEAFEQLDSVLEDLAKKMAFRVGGVSSAEKAIRTKTVNTVELESGLQISGVLTEILKDGDRPAYLKFSGPSLLAFKNTVLPGHKTDHHKDGFGTPLGRVKAPGKSHDWVSLSMLSPDDCYRLGIKENRQIGLEYETGAQVRGTIKNLVFQNGRLILLSLVEASAHLGSKILFEPSWGVYDIACGTDVKSVYSGAADREAYGQTIDFVKKTIPKKVYSSIQLGRHHLFDEIRTLRRNQSQNSTTLATLWEKAKGRSADDWLIQLEILELSENLADHNLSQTIKASLDEIANMDPNKAAHIQDAKRTLHMSY